MTVVDFTPRLPKPTVELVSYLRELADIIEADMAETEPRAALIVLTGPTRHEVLHVGNQHERGFIRAAIAAARAVHWPSYDTHGGNIRPRTHEYAGGPDRGALVPIRRKDKPHD